MRKTLICMLALLMLVSAVLTACGGGDSGTESKPGESTSQPESGKKPGGETKPSEKPSGNSTESPACTHEIVVDAGIEATCTTPGKTEGSHCAKCGEILVAQEVIPAGHLFVGGKCTRCGLETSKGLEYALNEDENSYSVIGIGSCTDTDLVIPPTYEEKPVTSIGDEAFGRCIGLTGVTIPDSVTSIGWGAFGLCTGLTSVTIGNSVTSIGDRAFSGCKGLTSITVPDSVIVIGRSAFQGCTGLTGITVPDSVIVIGGSAFQGCTGLTSVTVPSSVISMGSLAFAYCTGLTSVTILDGITFISEQAFFGCTGLTSITIPDSVISIRTLAFQGCTALMSITIPDSVRSIGQQAFCVCESLTNITVPDSVTYIGRNAFAGTAYYENSSNWENDVLYIGNCLIKAKDSLSGSYSIKEGTVCIADSAFQGCTGLTGITVPDSVIVIGGSAFYGCTGLTSITIPDSVTSIGIGAFKGTAYYNDESNWENNVLYIGKYLIRAKESLSGSYSIKDGTVCIAGVAFDDCTDLTSVTIPDSVTSIGDQAFSGCSGLTSVTIPDSVTSIGYHAFSGCAGLTSVTIPDSVSIGGYAFNNCSALTSITIGHGVTSIVPEVFEGTAYYNDESNWENGVLYIGKYLIQAKDSLSGSYSIKEGTICIVNDAFLECEGITSITIPDSVTSIGDEAFLGCMGLKKIAYNGTVKQWQEISKGIIWKTATGEFTVYCTDGEISKADA